MGYRNPFTYFPGGIFETLLPDFILSFTLFTSLSYAVLSKRFEHQRSAVGMAGAIGMSLSIGLVAWERQKGLSIKNLGPVSVFFAVIVLALVMYKVIARIGGSWAGVGIALGLSILIIMILGFESPIDPQAVYSIMVVALIVGFIAFLFHYSRSHSYTPYARAARKELPYIRDDISRLYRDRTISKGIGKGLRRLRKDTELLGEEPEKASDLLVQLKRILPAEGWLSEQMARLREKAQRIRKGHILRLDETKQVYRNLPKSERKRAAAKLVERYNQLIDIDKRLERLESVVSENENRVRLLTKEAKTCVENYQYRRFDEIIKQAEKLQSHNSKIVKLIERTERKLSRLAQTIAKQAKGVDNK